MGEPTNWWELPLTVCPVCGKEFAPAPEHAWKIGAALYRPIDTRSGSMGKQWKVELVCSYHCQRAWEKEYLAKKKK